MTTINETVSGAMRQAGLGSYEGRVTPVVNALIEREQRIYTGIVNAAQNAGVEGVADLLVGLGMAQPSVQQPGTLYATPASTPFDEVDDEDMETEDRVENLQARINSLEAFARANGYTG